MTTIKLKNGSGAPLAGDLVQGEPALDLTNKRLYTEDSGGTVIEVGTNPSELTVTGDLAVDTNTLFVDASADAVGIGTSTPGHVLTVRASSATNLAEIRNIDGGDNHGLTITDGSGVVELAAVYSSSAPDMTFKVGNSERMRIDSSGNVGIGTANPQYLGHFVDGDVAIVDTDTTNNAEKQSLLFGGASGETATLAAITGYRGSNANFGELVFKTSPGTGVPTEAMRIDSSGNLLVGTTSQINDEALSVDAGNTRAFQVRTAQTAPGSTVIQARTAVGGTGTTVFIVRSDGDLENTNNSYGALSDARLKSNIVDASSQIDDIMAVQVRSYTLDSTGDTHIGVVAQELEEAGMSGLVQEDEEGMKSVKYSVLYMKAIKAIQEQQAMIEDLKAEVAALKGA